MMFLLGVYLKRLTAPPLIKVTLSLNLVWQSLMHCGMPSEDRVTSKSNYFLDGYKKKKKTLHCGSRLYGLRDHQQIRSSL